MLKCAYPRTLLFAPRTIISSRLVFPAFCPASVFQATLDVCEDDWDTVGFPTAEEENFCEAAPWSFDVPLYASWTAIAHVRVF